MNRRERRAAAAQNRKPSFASFELKPIDLPATVDAGCPDLKDLIPESHLCIDCGFDTSPGKPTRAEAEKIVADQIAAGVKNWSVPVTIHSGCEVYMVHNHVWNAAGMDGFGGCLCIGCLEKRLGRELKPSDFDADHAFMRLPGTPRLLQRRGRYDPLGDWREAI